MTKGSGFLEIKLTISGMQEDPTIPRNVKERLREIFEILEKDGDISLKVDKSIQLLDEINDDSNLQSYTRTQVWNLVSVLEKNRLVS